MVALRVKHYAAAAGLDAAEFAGHSLRSGWITTAARAGLSGHTIRRVSGHRSQAMVEEYIQHESAFEASGKGLI
jgi:integrase